MLEKFTFNIEDTNYVSSFSPVPAWMSEEAIKTLNQGYLLPGECPRDLYYRVACQSARILNRPELMRDLFDILYKGFLGLATPVASNFGANRGLPISCFGANLSDNIPSIYSHLKEGAMMSKNGGGVAFSYSNIRGAGAAITGGGISTGVVPVVQQYDKCAGYVNQGGVRRGSFAHYLSIEHTDAYELLLAKDHLNGDPRKMIDGNIAFTITDSFMKKVLSGNKEASRIFGKALETNLKTGSPYFFFIDNVNKANPQAYINHNLKVDSSNLCCLSGDTLVLTRNGPQEIETLVGQTVSIFDGKDWQFNSKFKYYGEDYVYCLYLSDKSVLKMTGKHRCLLGDSKECLAQDLKIGDELFTTIQDLKITIENIELSRTKEKVYCTNVSTTSYFTLGNYILTGNSEITLFTDEGHSFVCCLSSLNLARWNEWKDWKGTNTKKSVVELSIYLLDSVIEEFIKRAKNMVGMGRSVRSAEKGRALG